MFTTVNLSSENVFRTLVKYSVKNEVETKRALINSFFLEYNYFKMHENKKQIPLRVKNKSYHSVASVSQAAL